MGRARIAQADSVVFVNRSILNGFRGWQRRCTHARPVGARIHLLHVFAAGEVEVTKLLAEAAAPAGSDVPVTVAATGGDPAREVVRWTPGFKSSCSVATALS